MTEDSKEMVYEITLANHLKALQTFFIFLVLMIVVYYKCLQINIISSDDLVFFILYFLIHFVAVAILHLEYYHYNHDMMITINELNNELLVKCEFGKENVYGFDEIKEIVLYLAPSVERRSYFRFFPTENYHYASIYMNDGKELIFTSLLTSNVEDAINKIEGVTIIKRWNFYASPKLRKLMWGV